MDQLTEGRNGNLFCGERENVVAVAVEAKQNRELLLISVC